MKYLNYVDSRFDILTLKCLKNFYAHNDQKYKTFDLTPILLNYLLSKIYR